MVNECEAKQYIEALFKKGDRPIKADVGYYWLNYTDFLIGCYDAKMICLKRDKSAVVNSFMSGLQNPVYGNLVMDAISKQTVPLRYSEYVTQDDLDKMDESTREFVEHYWDEPLIADNMLRDYFPQYEITDRKSYLSQYWESYYSDARKYADKYPNNFLLIDMNTALNSSKGQETVFNFIGVAPAHGKFHVGRKPFFAAAAQ